MQPSKTSINPVDGQRYVWIPPGDFDMGASPEERPFFADKPRHRVTITRGFWIGETPVTVGAYKRFVTTTGRAMPEEPVIRGLVLSPGWKLEQLAMTMVNCDDCAAYAEWAGLRLPTEAEWEYAARGGTTESRYGDLNVIAWTANNSGDSLIDSAALLKEVGAEKFVEAILENNCRPREVRTKQPNAFGLYDMLGNVSEWTADWFDADYYEKSPREDPQGPAVEGAYRVFRGGSWTSTPAFARLSDRHGLAPLVREINVGFRCAGNEMR